MKVMMRMSKKARRNPGLFTYVQGASFQVIVMISTIIALFGPDLINAAFPIPVGDLDSIHGGIMVVVMAVFTFEMLVLMCCSPKGKPYTWSFYFWLDLIGTLSLIPDLITLFKPTGVDSAEFPCYRQNRPDCEGGN